MNKYEQVLVVSERYEQVWDRHEQVLRVSGRYEKGMSMRVLMMSNTYLALISVTMIKLILMCN